MAISMKKPYDKADSMFQEIFLEFGFSDKWIAWIMECITSVPMTMLINGKADKTFYTERKIRQGDPNSPYIFVIY